MEPTRTALVGDPSAAGFVISRMPALTVMPPVHDVELAAARTRVPLSFLINVALFPAPPLRSKGVSIVKVLPPETSMARVFPADVSWIW